MINKVDASQIDMSDQNENKVEDIQNNQNNQNDQNDQNNEDVINSNQNLNWYKIAMQAEEMFDINKTDMPLYDNMLKNPNYFRENKNKIFEIVYMSSKEYYNKIAKGFWSTSDLEKYYQDYQDYRNSGFEKRLMPSNLEKIEKHLALGNKFPMPVIEYDEDGMLSQKGHHRVKLAEIKGINSIPVMVVKNWKN